MDPRKIFLIKRAIALLMFGIVAIQIGPSLADVLSPSPDPMPVSSPLPDPTPTSSSTAIPIQSVGASPSATSQPSGTYIYVSTSDSPTPEPTLADEQDIILRVPVTFPVDPRATSVRIAPVNIYSSGDVIVCISTSGSHLWLSNQSQTVLIKGNSSKFITLSGPAPDVTKVLNSGQGIRVGGTPRVQGAVVFSRAAVVTRPTLNSDLCGEAPISINSAVVALGLGMDTVKNPVGIK